MLWTGQLETMPSLAHAQGALPQKLIIWHSWTRGADSKQPPQLEKTPSHVPALAATSRVKLVFKPRLSSLPSVLFPNKFTLRYGFRLASGAKPKAAYCSTNLMVLWPGWTGDRRDWGCLTSVQQQMGSAWLFLSFCNCLILSHSQGSGQ